MYVRSLLFLLRNSILLYACTKICFFFPSVFYFNKAAMNICVQVSVWTHQVFLQE